MKAGRPVLGKGPVPCEFMLVGSQPGYEEDRAGVPFVGKTGQELDRFLDGDRLPSRDQVYLTNIYSVYKGKEAVYTAEDLERERPRLREEIARVRPKLIITLGREAARFFLGDIDLEDTHSIPWQWPQDPKVTIFVIVHIAAGLRNPESAALVTYGFEQLAAFLDGSLPERKLYDDPYPNPVYSLVRGKDVCSVLQRY